MYKDIGPQVEAVNLEKKEAFLSTSEIIPITAVFNDELGVSVSAVAGPDRKGRWYSIDLMGFNGKKH